MSASDPGMVRLADRPRLFMADDFASADELAHVEGRADASEEAALPVAGDAVLEALTLRLQRALKMGDALPDVVTVERVSSGEEREPGLDVLRMREIYRMVSAILFLEPPAEGGALRFPLARPREVVVHPRRGRLVAWINHRPNGEVEPLALHGLDAVEGAGVHALVHVHRALPFAARLVQSGPAPGGAEDLLEVDP